MPVNRWRGAVDDSDCALLAHCEGPTLDIGCGPGRMSGYLAAAGHCVLGLDILGEAVAQTRHRGVAALQRDVFGPLPAEGRWKTALLADGNIGIGGDPVRLLRRRLQPAPPGGRVVTDLEPEGTGAHRVSVRLSTADRRSHPFPWAIVGVDGMAAVALLAGLQLRATYVHSGRCFAVLGRV